MKTRVSVGIPAYNAAATIRAALDSVLQQTYPLHEILVLDDGSTDETFAIVESYLPRVKIRRQSNHGLAAARNVLCEWAEGDLVAFIDSDDLWHPRYIEKQVRLYLEYPQAAAFFAGHHVFSDAADYEWPSDREGDGSSPELIAPLEFLKRYNATPGWFYMSFCCIPKAILSRMGTEPFSSRGIEACYFANIAPFFGPVVFNPECLTAYRTNQSKSLTSQKLRLAKGVVEAFGLLQEYHDIHPDPERYLLFREAYAMKRRSLGKVLLYKGQTREAREEFWKSLFLDRRPRSLARGLVLCTSTYLPTFLRPDWLGRGSYWKDPL
jgi:glycosyltransferase involved in cell wall biosynthesis